MWGVNNCYNIVAIIQKTSKQLDLRLSLAMIVPLKAEELTNHNPWDTILARSQYSVKMVIMAASIFDRSFPQSTFDNTWLQDTSSPLTNDGAKAANTLRHLLDRKKCLNPSRHFTKQNTRPKIFHFLMHQLFILVLSIYSFYLLCFSLILSSVYLSISSLLFFMSASLFALTLFSLPLSSLCHSLLSVSLYFFVSLSSISLFCLTLYSVYLPLYYLFPFLLSISLSSFYHSSPCFSLLFVSLSLSLFRCFSFFCLSFLPDSLFSLPPSSIFVSLSSFNLSLFSFYLSSLCLSLLSVSVSL